MAPPDEGKITSQTQAWQGVVDEQTGQTGGRRSPSARALRTKVEL